MWLRDNTLTQHVGGNWMEPEVHYTQTKKELIHPKHPWAECNTEDTQWPHQMVNGHHNFFRKLERLPILSSGLSFQVEIR